MGKKNKQTEAVRQVLIEDWSSLAIYEIKDVLSNLDSLLSKNDISQIVLLNKIKEVQARLLFLEGQHARYVEPEG